MLSKRDGDNAQAKLSLPTQRFGQPMVFSLNLKNLDGLVRRTGCKPSAIVIQDSIMLMTNFLAPSSYYVVRRARHGAGTYNHIIMTRVADDLGLEESE